MMRSLFSGVSGLKIHQTRMDVIGNNIANINTIGFKGSRTTFSDMLSQLQSNASAPSDNRGGINPRQIGLGAAVESIDLLFTDASPQQTGKNTDLALSGNGLFYLKNGEQEFFTRNGAFAFDELGYYVLPGSGLRVQGWNADDEGYVNTNALATDVIVPVGKTMEATATTAMDYSGNLNKETLLIEKISFTTAPGVDPDTLVDVLVTQDADGNTTSVNVDGESIISATITLKDGTTRTLTSGYYEVNHSIPVTTLATIYDSLGGKHEVTVLIDKAPYDTDANSSDASEDTATGNAYSYTDADGNTYPVTLTTAYTYTDADGNTVTVPASQVTTNDDGTYSYTDSDGNVHTVTRTDTYTYTDTDGATQTVAEGDVTTTPTYDNRWRVYIAPGVGQIGPASDNFTNIVTTTESDGSTMTATMNQVTYLYFDQRGHFVTPGETGGAISFTYTDGNGAAENTANIDFSAMTQYANNTTSFPTTNGNTAGTLQSVAIDSLGYITGTYTNGLRRSEALIAVAQFSNAAGLTKAGTTIYQESNNSGTANIKTLNDFGMTVIASALEMSNVDLASEFADMIITQRGFQANSKITTVADEMLETVVNMKR